jgi:hypothetical protein
MGTPIPEETKQLAYLVGTWEGDATFMFMGQESKGKAAFTAKMGVGGRFLVAEHTYEIAGMGQFHGLQIVGYDAAKKEWAGWWYDSAESGNMEMHGTIAGDLMTMTSKPTPMEGMGEVVMRTESKRVSDTRIEMRLSMKQGEEWAPMMVITYNKK